MGGGEKIKIKKKRQKREGWRGEKQTNRERGGKEGRKKRMEEEGRGDLRNLNSIEPSNLNRSISNFDLTFYSTLETAGWSPSKCQWSDFRRSKVIFWRFLNRF